MYPGDLVKCEPRNWHDNALNGAIGLLIEYHVPAGGPGLSCAIDGVSLLTDNSTHFG